MPTVPRLYVLADRAALGTRSLLSAVRAMVGAGVDWIQVRAKEAPDGDLYRELEAVCAAIDRERVELWVNDRVDLAALLPVAGVHLGQQDLPPRAARRLLGPGQRIGLSTHDRSQLERAAADPAVDVVAFGPIFSTANKVDPDPTVGVEELGRVRRLTAKPLVAIGGITAGNLGRVAAAGADAVAVLGAACHGDVEANCARLLEALAGAATA